MDFNQNTKRSEGKAYFTEEIQKNIRHTDKRFPLFYITEPNSHTQ